MNVGDLLREGFAAAEQAVNQRGPDGLRAFYHVGGSGLRARWCRPSAMTLAQMQRVIAGLAREGLTEEAAALRRLGRQRFGPGAILSREDALATLAEILRVPVATLLE